MTKLIRDLIPEFLKNKGINIQTYIASEEEYSQKLLDKLKEETEKFIKDESIEELADILEVIDAIIKHKKFSKEKLNLVKEQKRFERGSFDKRLMLVK